MKDYTQNDNKTFEKFSANLENKIDNSEIDRTLEKLYSKGNQLELRTKPCKK